MGEILKELPAVILRGSVLLPGVVSHFDISTQRSIHAVEAAMNDDNHIFLVTQKDMQTEHAKQEDVYTVGVERRIPKSTGCAGRGRKCAGAAATGSGGSDAAQSAGKTVVLLYF